MFKTLILLSLLGQPNYQDLADLSVTITCRTQIHLQTETNKRIPTILFNGAESPKLDIFRDVVGCSGVLIKKEKHVFVLISGHVYDEIKKYDDVDILCRQKTNTIYDHNTEAQSYKCRMLFYDENADLAVLQIVDEYKHNVPTLKWSLNQQIGDTIYVCSSPFGVVGHDIITKGIVSRCSKYGNINTVDITALVADGSSGGIVVNENGEFCGIILGMSDGPVVSLTVPSKAIKQSLLKNKLKWLYNDTKCPTNEELNKLAEKFNDE